MLSSKMKQQTERESHLRYLVGRSDVVGLLSTPDLSYRLRIEIGLHQLFATTAKCILFLWMRHEPLFEARKGSNVIEEPWPLGMRAHGWGGLRLLAACGRRPCLTALRAQTGTVDTRAHQREQLEQLTPIETCEILSVRHIPLPPIV